MDSSSNQRVCPGHLWSWPGQVVGSGCAPWLAVAVCNFGMRCIIALLAKTSDSPIYWHLIYMARMFMSGTCLFVFVLGWLVCFVEPGRHMKDVEKKNGGFVSSAVSCCFYMRQLLYFLVNMVHQNEAPVSRCSWDAACTCNSSCKGFSCSTRDSACSLHGSHSWEWPSISDANCWFSVDQKMEKLVLEASCWR